MEWWEKGVGIVETYGWFMLIGGGLLYVLYGKYKESADHHAVYNPERVERLELERRKQRLKQQAAWNEKAESMKTEIKVKAATVKKEEDHLYKKYGKERKKVYRDDSGADWMQDLHRRGTGYTDDSCGPRFGRNSGPKGGG
mmetsp:Transcript_12173/g.17345  ORF Transcript_12173/g.17345 Transcript_12173/m.17345 type:complete len:141 (+) Transcript_12173:2-424(+)|eukprot:CAMPEP_0175152360 /NCGR_PEP_ID=MMETSP0087-20121206/19061_1 /TAXON_ID=136419 /ORGANISM="Unknown Unknown, Strain D1" /LENGTH=140 /DNA_ID=CAMNT_0016438765 /DNA_START=14 /DNA_END=436 /DNA_ORIENTATION=-